MSAVIGLMTLGDMGLLSSCWLLPANTHSSWGVVQGQVKKTQTRYRHCLRHTPGTSGAFKLPTGPVISQNTLPKRLSVLAEGHYWCQKMLFPESDGFVCMVFLRYFFLSKVYWKILQEAHTGHWKRDRKRRLGTLTKMDHTHIFFSASQMLSKAVSDMLRPFPEGPNPQCINSPFSHKSPIKSHYNRSLTNLHYFPL